ncbi:hypothetical protein GCM10007989_06220 [Devosia pacifica]|uniref:Uncharacterized protein n=1 Tax=Devosia pacifica TaxID=1335967 RepID=A0A918VQI3_9HYPH|nr:DUF6665 family protein [Devosia pacifica]GHA14302.1 hypothetical protein GCM10007989_06220 [Devosia pacifica]
MSLKDSLDMIRMVRPQTGTAALDHEIMAERASSLGEAERRVKKSIAELKAEPEDRKAVLATARRYVWEYFVQRELSGFRRHTDVIRDLDIPSEVLAGLGVMPAKRQT